jgi:hypothetical protein
MRAQMARIIAAEVLYSIDWAGRAQPCRSAARARFDAELANGTPDATVAMVLRAGGATLAELHASAQAARGPVDMTPIDDADFYRARHGLRPAAGPGSVAGPGGAAGTGSRPPCTTAATAVEALADSSDGDEGASLVFETLEDCEEVCEAHLRSLRRARDSARHHCLSPARHAGRVPAHP